MEGSTFVPGLLEVVASNWFGLEIPCLLSAAAGKKRGQGNRDWGGGGHSSGMVRQQSRERNQARELDQGPLGDLVKAIP